MAAARPEQADGLRVRRPPLLERRWMAAERCLPGRCWAVMAVASEQPALTDERWRLQERTAAGHLPVRKAA